MRLWPALVPGVLSILFAAGACGDDSKGDGSGGDSDESTCEKLCRRAGEADEACAGDDCVSDCDNELPQCDGEYRDLVSCLADAEMLGCETNSGRPMALNACGAEEDSLGACLQSGTGGATGSGGSGAGGEGNAGPCDPMQASCVGCGSETCGEAQACCWDATPTCGGAGSCTGVTSACDGAEDCDGGSCCVSFLTVADGTASSGAAECSGGGGGSLCCNPTPGVTGCAADPAVEQCVCGQDPYCCNTEWDAMCVGELEQFGCGTCGAGSGCEMGNGSTGTGSSIKSVSCRSSNDCSGIVGEFGVPYSECCRAKNFGVGACVSQTYAGSIAESGGNCN